MVDVLMRPMLKVFSNSEKLNYANQLKSFGLLSVRALPDFSLVRQLDSVRLGKLKGESGLNVFSVGVRCSLVDWSLTVRSPRVSLGSS